MGRVMAEHIDDQEARRRSVERMKASGHAPAWRRNGHDHAPAAEQITGRRSLRRASVRFERQIAVLKGQVDQLVARSDRKIATGLSEKAVASLTKGLAQSIAPFVKDCIKEAMATLRSASAS